MMELTLQDLAGACGVTFQQVHKYESGLCSLSASQLCAPSRTGKGGRTNILKPIRSTSRARCRRAWLAAVASVAR